MGFEKETYCSSPLVSVYWISAYRKDYLNSAIQSFLNSTDYPNLELIVVDCSIGEKGNEIRTWLKNNKELDQIIFRESLFCEWNNGNKGFEVSHGDYIIQFEDDVIFSPDTPKDWIQKAIKLLNSGGFDAVDLWRKTGGPSSPGFLTNRQVREKWGVWPCYPTDYSTISEAQAKGARKVIDLFEKNGLICKGFNYLRTSMEAPSINIHKLAFKKGISYKDLDNMLIEGTTVVRIKDGGYVSDTEYQDKGGWHACDFDIQQPPEDFDKLVFKGRLRLIAFKLMNLIPSTFRRIKLLILSIMPIRALLRWMRKIIR